MKIIKITLLFILILTISQLGLKVFPQQQNTITNKQGGICFRVDDVQLANRWSEFISVFRKYDYKATFALNLGSMLLYFPSSYVDTLLKMQSEGHEIMDHTPDHRTHYLINIKDTNYYSGREGVDHISRDTVCLRWDSARTTTFINEGLIDIDGNTVISRTAGDLYDIDGLNFIYAIYVPDINKIFRVGNIRNRVRTDVDTLTITSFWDERVNIGTLSGVQYHKLAMYDVRMSDSAIYLLADRSRQLFNQLNLTLPKTWIQTGGPTPQFYREELKRVLEPNFSYTAGATYPNRSLKGFNEYNPNDDKQFGMQWEDFRDDIWTLQRNKEVIADRLARHYVSIGASHFDRGGSLLGGWTGYLGRVDSLLMWCKENNIPVMTYAEWSDILYKTAQDPNINIFPKLNVDLDKNNIPDGYYTTLPGYTDGVWDTTDGVAESGFKSYRLNRTGSIAFINDLAGLEKGSNDFYIWTKGSSGSVITVYFIFPELGNQTTTFTFPASTSEWTKYDLSQSTNGNTSLNIPENVSYADIRISCTSYGGGWIGISGMSLKKKQDQYTIFVTQNDHGTISPGTITLDRGSNQTFLITPENGYYVDSVFVDNVYIPDSTTSYTFTNITDNHTIYAKFKILTYTINATAIGNGTIIPAGTITVNHGDNQTFTTSPADGFHVDSILVDGIKVDSLNSYTFINVIAPHTITAYFSINKYTINASAGPNGAISPSGVITVNHGDDTTFTFTPDFGYYVDSVFVDNIYIPDSTTSYTFTNITDNHTIYAKFKILTYTINATAIGNGTIIPSGTITVNHGDNQNFTTAPADGFHVDSILVDGIRVDSLNSYTFINVIAPHTITAYFSINKYTITASAGPNGAISPSGVITVNHGDDTTFTFTPDFGYHVDSIFVDNVYIPDSITQYTFTNITDNHTIYVNFGEDNKIGTISGIVYHDLNLDSSWNNNEPGLEGCLVTLYNDGKIVDSVLTDAAGHFTFQNLPIGIYTIRERLLEGWKHASPPSGEYQDIVVSNNQIISINFGNFQEGQYIRIPISIYDQTKTPTLTIMFGVRIGAAFGIWGIDPSATEVDKYEGERELPPIAPQFIDARFINPEQSSNLFGNGSWNDVRGFTDVIQVDTYKVQITPGNSGYPITLRWQKETIENSYYGEVILNDLHGTIVDMKSTDSLVITSDNISNVLIIANQPKIKYLFKKGWNLVSLPKRTDTSEINSIFKQSNNYAYAFDPNIGYVLKGKLNPGIGYWLNFIAPQESVYIAGDERLSDTINVVEGWNLIGSLSKVMSVSEVMTDPSGIIESDFFKYDAGYSVANYLEPFSGYWIKVSNAGKLILNTNGLSKNSTDNSRISDRDEKIIKIKIRDSEGSEGTLTLALKDEKSRNYKLREIPPLPPDNIFDVRFKSNTLNEIIEENCEKEFPVLISTDKYPLTIRWEKKYQQFNFSLKINDQIIVIDEDGVVNIADSVFKISIIVRPVNEIITEYRLDQNYPNPFNPITTIRYYLPVRSNVTLKVYDILGQNLATLVEEVQDAGVRDIKWDAGSFSSSIYFYRLEATDVNDPTRSYTYMRKMLVIK